MEMVEEVVAFLMRLLRVSAELTLDTMGDRRDPVLEFGGSTEYART